MSGTTMHRRQITLRQAQRIALAAQGFGVPRPARPTVRQVQGVIDRLGVVQIDSVNVLARAQYLPFYSRLGPYDPALVDRARDQAPRRLVEYWAHAASLVPPSALPLLRWRMDGAREQAWGGMRAADRDHPGLAAVLLEQLRHRGPLTAVELERAIQHEAPRDRTEWGWNWSVVKRLLELLFWAGEVTSAGRDGQFARRYDLPERVLPPEVVRAPAPTEAQACRELVRIGARAFGVATEADLRDYFRLGLLPARTAVAALVEDGELEPVAVQGWPRPAYLHVGARRPRQISARALISPFDSLVWHRPRTQALWGFDYTIEIYVPAARRRYGYYVLPFLLGQQLVARVDLKADRQAGVLRVQSAHAERGAPADTAVELAAELGEMARWLGLGSVLVVGPGDLAPALAEQVRYSPA